MWGLPIENFTLGRKTRFIPTYVGLVQVNPEDTQTLPGSPPRTWGTHSKEESCIPQNRFIPTNAGLSNIFLLPLKPAAFHVW